MLNQKPQISANKNSRYKINEESKGFYHLRVIVDCPTADEYKPIVEERVITFSPRDFAQFLKHKKHFRFREEEIIHDPTYVKKDETPEEPEQGEEPETKPKAAVSHQGFRPGRKPLSNK